MADSQCLEESVEVLGRVHNDIMHCTSRGNVATEEVGGGDERTFHVVTNAMNSKGEVAFFRMRRGIEVIHRFMHRIADLVFGHELGEMLLDKMRDSILDRRMSVLVISSKEKTVATCHNRGQGGEVLRLGVVVREDEGRVGNGTGRSPGDTSSASRWHL